jgi:putative transposase
MLFAILVTSESFSGGLHSSLLIASSAEVIARRLNPRARSIPAVLARKTCIVHLIRNSLSFVTWKDRKAILPSIKAIYRAENADQARVRLEEFEAEWGKRYPAIGQAWRRAWEYVIPFFAFAPGIRKMIYTTNAVEALNRSLRKIIKTRGSFPNDEAALKLLYLAIKNAGLRWRRPIDWTNAMGQFAIQFADRFPTSAN